jgi:molybdopterin-containing oxidoreductase family iron-sulfur binding subunit
VEYTRGYASRRRPVVDGERPPSKSYHVQIESRLSLTGSNADQRLRVAPGEMGHLITRLAVRLVDKAGFLLKDAELSSSTLERELDAIAARLEAGRGLVISSSQDVRVQVLCNLINESIGAYGATLDLERPSYQRQGSDNELAELGAELTRGS